MKNNFFKYFILIFLVLLNSSLLGDDLVFDTESINITNSGEITIAKNGKVILTNEKLEITGKQFEYDNKKKILVVLNAISRLTDDNIEITANKISYDRVNFNLVAKGNVELKNLKNNSQIFTEELIYNKKKER